MRVAIVHDSRTGNTAAAAEKMAAAFREKGHTVELRRVAEADGSVATADVICVGSWTQGLFIVGQHPTAAIRNFVETPPDMKGKVGVAFCSYAFAPGRTLDKLAGGLAAKGAKVGWQLPFRGQQATNWAGFVGWIADLEGGTPTGKKSAASS
jgi:flavodoxin